MKAVLDSLPGVDIMYTVEISPSLTKNSVFVLPVEPIDNLLIGKLDLKNYSFQLLKTKNYIGNALV